jgi:hypothetical protein
MKHKHDACHDELQSRGGYFAAAPDDTHFRGPRLHQQSGAYETEKIWKFKRAGDEFPLDRQSLTIGMTGPAIMREYMFDKSGRKDSSHRIAQSMAFGIARELSPKNPSRGWLPQIRPAGEWTRPNWHPRRASTAF